MSREVRRVPLDFDWPLSSTWRGYLLPESLRLPPCTACGGEGWSAEARAIADTFYPHTIPGDRATQDALAWHDKIGQKEVDHLLKKGRLGTWRDGAWHHDPLTADEVNARQHAGALDGHDAINRGLLIEFRCKRLGISMRCPECQGHGDVEKYPGQRAEADAWEPTDPPTGDAWQLWETVSEGSPITPAFATADDLIEHLATVGTSWGGPLRRPSAEAIVHQGGTFGSFVAIGREVLDSTADADRIAELSGQS